MTRLSRKESLLVVGFGAVAYPLLEMLWRRRTHVSMAVAGGMCFSLLYRIHLREKPLLARCLAGALSITAVELITGLIVNRLLHLRVWDYSRNRFHLLGQVCLRYSLYWFALSGLIAPVCGKMRLHFTKRNEARS